MTRFLLSLFAVRFFSPRQRRILVLGSFYSLLRSNVKCLDKMAELNDCIALTTDPKSLLLAAELPHILWGKEKCTELERIPPEKLKRYYRELLPSWLKYDLEENGFDFEEDLSTVLNKFQQAGIKH